MSKETDYNEPHIVWYGIVSLFQFAQKYAAALRAYGEVYGDKESGNVYCGPPHQRFPHAEHPLP